MHVTFYGAVREVTGIKLQENGQSLTVGYTGDIGRFGRPILKNPTMDFETTILIVGYMARNTLGRRLLEKKRRMKKRVKKGSRLFLSF